MYEKTRPQTVILTALLVAVVAVPLCADDNQGDAAATILKATGVQGGLIVHVGCGDGKLTAALRANERYVVHGLDADPASVRAARAHIRSLGLYGPVSVRYWQGGALPYADNLVNLLIVQGGQRPSREELVRVLAPRGVAYVKSGQTWETLTKPWPQEMDEWTHFLHDASNNAVAQDTVVGPPRRLQWVCGPEWTRSHEFTSSLCAMVSAGGRIFYVFDHGLTGVTPKSLPEKWTLIARDAFNGILLWQRPIPKWGPGQWNSRALRSIPGTIPRRLVARGDRVFMTLGYHAPVSALHAATGDVLTTYAHTENTEEIRCIGDILILRQGRTTVLAIDTETGRKLWARTGKVQPFSLAARQSKVFYQDGQRLVCLDVRSGSELWQASVEASASALLVHDDCLVLSGRKNMQALSTDTGRPLWNIDSGAPRGELFVANGRLWHWQGEQLIGRGLQSGQVLEKVTTDDVFTPGHHFRCYQSKGTENYLITPNRGAEFISLTGAENTQNDWARGPCRYGIMPCNGLLYVPPNPCFCYPGVKITGFNALAPLAQRKQTTPLLPRLQHGPAYGQSVEQASASNSDQDWPTYRRDARRTGTTTAAVPAKVSPRWEVPLGTDLTPPVVAAQRVFVAAKDEHTLHAIHITDGRELWQFTADARIDSPPTIHAGLVLLGCADGHVYCLRASDGQLMWRFRAAPSGALIIAGSQLESPWRVHGSVLIEKGLVYFTAGRSSYLDGGIYLFALDPRTGELRHQARLDTWARTRKDAETKPFIAGYHMEGALSDILISQGGYIYLGQTKFDRRLVEQDVPYIMPGPDEKTTTMDLSGQPYVVADDDPDEDYETHQREWLDRTQKHLLESLRQTYGNYSLGHRQMGLHVFSTSGFLDTSWFNRTYWMYAATWPGYYLGHRGAKTGQLLVVGPEKTYAVQAYPSRNLQSPLFTPGEKGYLLLADRNDNEPVLDDRTRGTTKGWGFTRQEPPVWHQWLPVRIRAMVLAGENLFVAGPPDVVDPQDPMAGFEGRRGALLWTVSAADGKKRAEYRLKAPPVSDGLIAAQGRLFASLRDGRLVCLD